MAPVIVARKERILFRQRLGPHAPLDDVGVHLDAPVVEEADEPVPMMEGIADDLCRVRLARQTCVLLLKPDPELCSHFIWT